MRFTDFWAELLSQNQALKWGLFSVSTLCVVLAISLTSIAVKDPIVIERECLSQVVGRTSPQQTKEEIERFVQLVLPMRFDTAALDSKVYLAEEELSARRKELEDFSKKQVSQRILVNSVRVGDSGIAVEADRILSIGKVRSALPVTLRAVVKTTDRSPANPYGLILSNTERVSTEGDAE